MANLIDRQAAIDAYGDWYVEEGTAEGFIGTVKQLLEGLPSAEPEIMRCKDCKYFRGDNITYNCMFHLTKVVSNGFCAWAESEEDVYHKKEIE